MLTLKTVKVASIVMLMVSLMSRIINHNYDGYGNYTEDVRDDNGFSEGDSKGDICDVDKDENVDRQKDSYVKDATVLMLMMVITIMMTMTILTVVMMVMMTMMMLLKKMMML